MITITTNLFQKTNIFPYTITQRGQFKNYLTLIIQQVYSYVISYIENFNVYIII